MKDYEVKKEGSMLTITLGEELAVANAPALMDELALLQEVSEHQFKYRVRELQQGCS